MSDGRTSSGEDNGHEERREITPLRPAAESTLRIITLGKASADLGQDSALGAAQPGWSGSSLIHLSSVSLSLPILCGSVVI